MVEGTYKVIQLVGSSENSWEDAVKTAVESKAKPNIVNKIFFIIFPYFNCEAIDPISSSISSLVSNINVCFSSSPK